VLYSLLSYLCTYCSLEYGAGGEEKAVHSEQSLQVCDVLPLTLLYLMLEDGAGG
jgi:hypothetical protein